jgi:hypothetical protein
VKPSKFDLSKLDPRFPPPGLAGNYHDACNGCLLGTDTVVAFLGRKALWEALVAMGPPPGYPIERAADLATLTAYEVMEPWTPTRPDLFVLNVCRDCAKKAGLEVTLYADFLTPGPHTAYGQTDE